MAKFTCSVCNYQKEVTDEHIHRAAKCPKCQSIGVVVPNAELDFFQPDDRTITTDHLVLRRTGGSAEISLTDGKKTNEGTSIDLQFITVQDFTLAAQFASCVGVQVKYFPQIGSSVAHFIYTSEYELNALAEIRAIEISFMLFNIWGRHTRTIISTHITDVLCRHSKSFSNRWLIANDEEAKAHYASIAYVSRVRVADGYVHEANLEFVMQEVNKFSKELEAKELDPNLRKRIY